MVEVHTSDQKNSTFLEKSRYQIDSWIITCNAGGPVREDKLEILKPKI
jgi:hypothetical protein